MGDGRQFFSWIHAEDFCRALDWILEHPESNGIYNICAPLPVTNRELMATLRTALGVPFGLPAALWMLEIGAVLLRTETELIIKSRRVVPRRLIAEGFVFSHPDLRDAVRSLEDARRESSVRRS